VNISYDTIVDAFLNKISEFEFLDMGSEDRESIVSGYMKRAVSKFKKICVYDLNMHDDESGAFTDNFAEDDVDEIVEIISEGMVVQWLKPYVNKQENLESVLNTSDYTTYSPAELLMRVGNAYKDTKKDYTQMIREYSFVHGDLTVLHL